MAIRVLALVAVLGLLWSIGCAGTTRPENDEADRGEETPATEEMPACEIADPGVFAPVLEQAMMSIYPGILERNEGFYVAPTSMHGVNVEHQMPWEYLGVPDDSVECLQALYDCCNRVKDGYFDWYPHSFIDDAYAKALYDGEVATADYDSQGYEAVFAVGLPVLIPTGDRMFFSVDEVSRPPSDIGHARGILVTRAGDSWEGEFVELFGLAIHWDDRI